MVEKKIEKAFKIAAKTLNEALRIYWCGYRGRNKESDPANNDISERNITFHFCKALADLGFQVYSEVGHNTADSRNGRIDFVSIYEPENTLLAIEAKRIYNAGDAGKILKDVDRLCHFNVQAEGDYIHGRVDHRYGIILGISWWRSVYEFWLKMDRSNRDGNWRSLSEALTRLGAKNLTESIGAPVLDPEEYEEGWIFCSYFKVPKAAATR